MITLIEGNIALKYGANIWQSAVLNVDSGLADGGNTDFVKVSTAVQKYKSSILPPNINTSKLGFYPQDDKIVYGVKPIVSINFEDANFIIDNQPYSSLDDFYEKCVVNGILTDRKVINLIKAGMFSDFDNKRQLMVQFISKICPPATRVSKVSTKKLLYYIPKELQDEAKLYISFDVLKKKCDDGIILEYNEFYKQFNINLLNYYNNNEIDKKNLKKEIDKNTQKLSDWFKTDKAKEAKTNYDRAKMWNKYCLGTDEQWEFEATNTYIGKSETSNYTYPESWGVTALSDIPDEPIVLGKNNRGYNIYKEYAIAGTVIDNNSNKNRITVITDDGIIDVKLFTYKYYNNKITKEIIKPDGKKEKVTVDPSWCSKGNNLILVGYKRNGVFYCSHRNHILNHSLVKIMGKNQHGKTIFKYEKG